MKATVQQPNLCEGGIQNGACEGGVAGEQDAGDQSNAHKASLLKLCGQATGFIILRLLHSTSLVGVLSMR